jgi:hypothetical protein
MKKLLSWAVGCCLLLSCNDNKTEGTTTSASNDSTTTTSSTEQKQAEFADDRYVDMGKKQLEQFSTGDIDGWMNAYADTAMYRWSAGDSLKGKTAIASYWKERRLKVIDSLQYSNDIWIPIKVNTSQRGPDIPGVWLLSWYQVNVKYKNGKRLMFWVHSDIHFNSADQIDQVIQYIDRSPINKALGVQ